MTRNTIISSTALLILLTAGCSTNAPIFGDRMVTQHTPAQGLADQWNKGKALMINGQKLLIESAKQRAKGKKMIAEGHQMMKESETKCKQRFPTKEINKL